MSDIFDAIADPTRRRILESLAAKPDQSVSDLVKLTKLGQPTVSKHLKVLRDAGLVKSKVSGSNHNYTLVEKPLLDVLSWLGKVGVARLERAAAASSKTTKRTKATEQDVSPLATLIGDIVAYGIDQAGRQISARTKIDLDAENLGRELGRKLSDAKRGGEKVAKDAAGQVAKAAKDVTRQAERKLKRRVDLDD